LAGFVGGGSGHGNALVLLNILSPSPPPLLLSHLKHRNHYHHYHHMDSQYYDTVVVGAGPQALTLVAHLLEPQTTAHYADNSPELRCKRKVTTSVV